MKNKRMKKNRKKFKSMMNQMVVENMANNYSFRCMGSIMQNLEMLNKNAVYRRRWRASHKQCVKHAKSTLRNGVKKF